jgi:putative addiction module antidote
MGITLKVRKQGNSLSTILPKEVAAHLKVKDGDDLYLVETRDGYSIAKYDPEFEKMMDIVEGISDRFKNAYRELAKR